MKKISFSLMLVFLAIGIRVELAEAVPDIRGEYYGSYTTVVTSCSDSASNGTYNAVLEMNIPTQSGNSFSGTATGTFNIDNSALIGGWFYNPGILAESGVLTIIDDTNYMFVVDGEPDDGGGRGMERGTYTWNPTTGAFTATAISKTLGDWGVSSLGEMTISVNENTLNVIESTEGPFSLIKISSESNPIVGSWFINPGSLADSAVVIFIDGTNYMFAVDGEPDDGGGRGMERGTYTWNSTTGAFTATAISGTAGDWGISYLTDPTASIDGNTLTIIDSNDGPIPLTKVEGFAPVEYIQLSGTITETGQVSGTTSHTFLGTGGEGTFTGQLSGNTLSIVNPGQDTYGDICNYTRTMSATRAGITPVANFSATSRNGNAPLSVNFTDESMGTITSWYWNFGDDANSTNQNPSHLYAVPGIYTVSLTVSGPAGSETETKIDYIFILSEPISSEWVAENNMLTARDSFTGGVIDGKIYVFGGNGNPKGINLKSTEMFDPETHLWIYKSSNENNNGQGVEELTGAVFNDKLYVFGAWGGGTPYGVFNFVQKYDPATDTWTSKAPKPTPVSSAIATIYNGEIFVFGGEYANDLGVDVTYDVVEAYNPISDSWRTVTNMPYTLGMMSIGIVGTKAYLIGGLDFDTYNIQQNVIAYDFESNHWITNGLGTLPTPRLFSYSSSAPIVDGKIYQIGGMVSNVGWTITGQSDVSITNDVLVYDPSTQSFSSGPPLPQATNSLLALSINNSIYAIGGETDWENDIRTNAVWRLDLAPKPNITPIISLLLDDEPEGNSALLEGEWNINGLASGDGAPWFERGNMFVGSDGTFTGSVTVNDGISKNISGKFNLSNDRILSLVGNSNFGGSLDLLNRVMVWTDTWTTGSPGTTELKVSTRQGESYSQANLTGTWDLNSLASGSGAPWWIRGPVTINSDGSFSGQLIDNLGDPDSASGTFTISPEGIVTWAGQDNLRCAMDSGKTIIACTNIWSYDYPNTTEMMIMTKMSGSYSLEDLSGTWESSGLATGPSAPWWERAHLEIGADGSFSATTLENDGSGHEILGNLQISSSGIITITGGPSFRGNMDANKTIMVWTDTWDSEGTTEMKVLTKVSN